MTNKITITLPPGDGPRIRFLRRLRDLSLRELGERIGVSYTYIYQWEKGKYYPSNEHIKRLCEALEVELEFMAAEGFEVNILKEGK